VTSSNVVKQFLNEEGKVDFNQIITAHFDYDPYGIDVHCENIAKELLGLKNWGFQDGERSVAKSFTQLNDNEVEEVFLFMKNYRKTGYLHFMDFARDKWGTKWNACNSTYNVDAGTISFDTAWTNPFALLIELSRKNPDDLIIMQFADEDLGFNCGQYELKNGVVIYENIAPSYKDLRRDIALKEKWFRFSCGVKGYSSETIEEYWQERLEDLKEQQ